MPLYRTTDKTQDNSGGCRLNRRYACKGLSASSISDLLLTFEGVNGSASVFDLSVKGNAMTNTGNGVISTTRSRSGESSFLSNGSANKLSGDKTLTIPGPFMWQCWWYPTAYAAGYTALLGIQGPSSSYQIFINDDGNRPLFFLKHRPGFGMVLDTNGSGIPLNQWNHLAFTRDDAGVLRIFLNGAQRGASPTFTETLIGVPVVLETFTGSGTLGHIDLVQMVTGQAVYTSNFTPSVEPYSA